MEQEAILNFIQRTVLFFTKCWFMMQYLCKFSWDIGKNNNAVFDLKLRLEKKKQYFM